MLVQFKLAELRSDKPFLWGFKLAWHLVQAAGHHFLFLIIADIEAIT